jgi:biotin carboxyl carrier protein
MFFEADLGGDLTRPGQTKPYKIEVNETKSSWKIALQEEGGEWVRYEISKDDYRIVENIVNLIWNGGSYLIDVYGSGIDYTVYTRSSVRTVKIYNDEALLHESLKKGSLIGGGENLVAGMPGKIVKVLVNKGDVLKSGQPVLIMEAMKMENEMRASAEVRVKDILVKPADSVESGQTLVLFEPVK